MNIIRNSAVLLTLLWLTGCAATYHVNSDYDREVNFRKYTSYKVAPPASDKKDPILNSQLMQKRIKDAVVAEMKSRGYLYKEDDADLLVRYYTDVENRSETNSYNNSPYWGWWGGRQNTYTRNYKEARLIIEFVDAKTDRLVWQGWAVGEETSKRNQDRDAAVRLTVAKILEEYPHRVNQPYNEDATSRR